MIPNDWPMPPKDMLEDSKYNCPNCGCRETYVDKRSDMFQCSDCEFSAPIPEVADR